MTKYIFITGGVVSSLGKGICAASLGALLADNGKNISILKMDPYINVDPGTMSPFQHGEVYVTDDGAETDLDLGNYERFTGATMSKINNLTTGQVYSNVIAKERRGDYLGVTVQVIPHITDEIISHIKKCGADNDILLVEVGGTVGDIESLPFLESIRQLSFDPEVGSDSTCYIHITLLPHLLSAEELKTKPTQHSLSQLRSIGIQPDIIICRSEHNPDESSMKKIALFSSLQRESIVSVPYISSIYDIPLTMQEKKIDKAIFEKLSMPYSSIKLDAWHNFQTKRQQTTKEVNIALIGKYVENASAYLSINESLTHSAAHHYAKVNIISVDTEKVNKDTIIQLLEGIDGILVPGGFGKRGVMAKKLAIQHAFENKIPFFGICFGMQLAILERLESNNILADCNSTEFDRDTKHPVISLVTEWQGEQKMHEQNYDSDKGSTMRLGSYPCHLQDKTLIRSIYGQADINERHRHRYEVNQKYVKYIEQAGVQISGKSPDGKLVESIEVRDHPWFIGVQFHPEFKSTPFTGHPLFNNFIEAAINR